MIILKSISPAQREKCILFFNGWGMDCNAAKHLQHDEYDVFTCYDYRDLCIKPILSSQLSFLDSYKEIYLVAWSLGVWVAERVLTPHFSKFTKTIAINGTPQPVDNNFGIVEQVFVHTLENWNEHNRKKFNARMCGGNAQLSEWQSFMSERSCEEQQEELQFLYDAIRNNLQKNNHGKTWTETIIGSNDLIFTAKNQQNYWHSAVNYRILPLPHFPFANFTSWNEIIT